MLRWNRASTRPPQDLTSQMTPIKPLGASPQPCHEQAFPLPTQGKHHTRTSGRQQQSRALQSASQVPEERGSSGCSQKLWNSPKN